MTDKLEALKELYPNEGDLLDVNTFVNFEAIDEEELPGGMVAVYDTEAKVNVDSIPDQAFNYLVICPINATEYQQLTDADFPIDARLDEAAPQFSDKPPSMLNMGEANNDMNYWKAELGTNARAGIYKSVQENGRSTKYFILVQAGIPLACSEFKDYIATHKGITFKQLLGDERYNYVKHLAQRNAKRIAYNIARVYKVPIAQITDASSYTSDDHVGQPMRAAPRSVNGQHGGQQAQSTIKLMPSGYKGKDAVAVYHNVRPIDEANDLCYIISNPYDGVAIFNMNRSGYGIGLPATTGRKSDPDALEFQDQKQIKSRTQGITWERSDSFDDVPKDLHPEAFHTIDSKFLKHMRSLGWKQKGVNNRQYLVPVAVKISNPKLKR